MLDYQMPIPLWLINSFFQYIFGKQYQTIIFIFFMFDTIKKNQYDTIENDYETEL